MCGILSRRICLFVAIVVYFVGIETASINVPLIDKLTAPLTAELDISRLTEQLKALIKEEVKAGVGTAVGLSLDNVRNQMKEDYEMERLKWGVPNVSFHARVSSPIPDIAPNDPVVFQSVITNNGNGYNQVTGVFTAPVNGTYYFASTILTKKPSVLEMMLQVNGITKMLMYASSISETYNNAASSVVLNLAQGDLVRIAKHGALGSRPFYIHHVWSTFTGMLIHTA